MIFYDDLIENKLKEECVSVSSFKTPITTDVVDNGKVLKNSILYNFDVSNGALTDGIGISNVVFKYNQQMHRMSKKVNFPENYEVLGCWYYPFFYSSAEVVNPLIIAYCSNKKFYYLYMHYPDSEMLELSDLSFQETPSVICNRINGVDTLILVSKSDGMYTWNPIEGLTKIENAPVINSMCIQYDRMFVTSSDERKSVLYSDSLNVADFNTFDQGGGILTLNDDLGDCNKVISFKGNVYIFRDYNIAKITAYGDDDEFVVSKLYVSNGKIFTGTICACGDRIIYLASDGLYSFDGTKSTKIDVSINQLFLNCENDLAIGNYSSGYYYLACRMNFNDDIVENCENGKYVNNTLIKYNLSSNEVIILRGYDIQDISVFNDSIDSYVIVLYHNGVGLRPGMLDMSGCFFDTPTHKVWGSMITDFNNPTCKKVLKEVTFESINDIDIQILCDGKTKKYNFKGKNGVQKFKPYIKGYKFKFIIESNTNNCSVIKPTFKVGVLC